MQCRSKAHGCGETAYVFVPAPVATSSCDALCVLCCVVWLFHVAVQVTPQPTGFHSLFLPQAATHRISSKVRCHIAILSPPTFYVGVFDFLFIFYYPSTSQS